MLKDFSSLKAFEFLKTKALGEKIKIQGEESPETVTLVRRGRQNIRIQKSNGESDLVKLEQVLVES